MAVWYQRATILGALLAVVGCQTATPAIGEHRYASVRSFTHSYLTDNGDANVFRFAQALRSARSHSVHIVQFGDSHTAADIFTGALRDAFQNRFGDGGIGFISPVAVPGQRYAPIVISRTGRDWLLKTSRLNPDDEFALGGARARPRGANRSVTIRFRSDNSKPLYIRALYQTTRSNLLTIRDGQGSRFVGLSPQGWGYSSAARITLPVTITLKAGTAGTEIGGWYLDRLRGVVFSTIGSNGASLSLLDHWQDDWIEQLYQIHPDLVILSYGTNESLNNKPDLEQYRMAYQHRIHQIRRAIPRAVILLMGPGDNASTRGGRDCRHMDGLRRIIAVQKEVARTEHTLFWDWRAFMGGACSIRTWRARGDARADQVHLLASGYQKSAQGFYRDLMHLLNMPP